MLRPIEKVAYYMYAGIMLDALKDLLCSKLCWYKLCKRFTEQWLHSVHKIPSPFLQAFWRVIIIGEIQYGFNFLWSKIW